jgi:Domain of unknown function (DUF4270)
MMMLPKLILTSTQNLFLNNIWRKVALMLFSAFILSCQDPIGIAIDTPSTGGQVVTVFTDTVKVAFSTIMLDSTVTSGQASSVIGSYKDPIFGEVSAKSFAQLTLPYLSSSSSYAILAFPSADVGLTVYDSVYVYLANDSFVYGDTTKPITLAVHRLTDDFVSSKNYTKDDALGYNPTPMASKAFSLKELKRSYSTAQDSLLKYKLPDTFGQELYDLVGKDAGTTIDKFTNAVKGLAFVANQDAAAVYGLSISNSYIQLYYHTTNSTNRKSIPLTFLSQRFSQIKSNRQGTALQNLQLFQSIPSSLTNNRTYMQTGLGISTKMQFPSLAALQKNKNITINKAELIIQPDLDQITGNFKPPAQFALVQISNDNRLKKTSSNVIDYVALDAISGTQYVAAYSSTNNNYSFNFTTYLQDLINKKQTSDGVALVPSVLSTTSIGINNTNVSRVVFKNIKLNVYYSTKK